MRNRPPAGYVIATVIMLVAATGHYRARAQDVPPTPADVAREADQSRRDALSQQAQRAFTRRLLDQAIARADSIVKLMASLKQESDAFAQRIAKLKDDDDGKRLASTLDELTARDFARIIDTPLVDAECFTVNQKQAEAVLAQLKAERDQNVPGYVPPDTLVEELNSLLKWTKDQRANVKQQNEWIEQQILGVPKEFDLAAAPTLRQKLASYRRQEDAARQTARLAGAEQAKKEGHAAIMKAERTAELERLLQNANARLNAARAEIEDQKIEQEMIRKKEQDQYAKRIADLDAELARNRAERAKQVAESKVVEERGKQDADLVLKRERASSPRVKEVLAPFASPGYYQPRGPMSIDKGPMSLAALRQAGALERNQKGLTALILAGVTPQDKERPRWGFQPIVRNLTAAQLELVKEAQQYMIDYGDVLVEMGVLAK